MEIYSRQGEKGGQMVKISWIWSQFSGKLSFPGSSNWLFCGYVYLDRTGSPGHPEMWESGRLSVLFSPISMVLFLLLKIGIELIYIVVLVSSVQQSESALYIYIYIYISIYLSVWFVLWRFFSHISYYRALSRVPCATQQVLIRHLFYIQ